MIQMNYETVFFKIVESNKDSMLQMAVQDGLPRWLMNQPDIDVWERCSRWVIEIAKTSRAARVIVLAFWDGVEDDTTGWNFAAGTACSFNWPISY